MIFYCIGLFSISLWVIAKIFFLFAPNILNIYISFFLSGHTLRKIHILYRINIIFLLEMGGIIIIAWNETKNPDFHFYAIQAIMNICFSVFDPPDHSTPFRYIFNNAKLTRYIMQPQKSMLLGNLDIQIFSN